MIDPLSSIVTLLQPEATFSKVVRAAGAWKIRREEFGTPFYCVVLDGQCELSPDGEEKLSLIAGDFVLIPETLGFTFMSEVPCPEDMQNSVPVETAAGMYFVGDKRATQNTHLLIGHCQFGSTDSSILLSLLPKLVHIRQAKRLKSLVELVIEESKEQRPGRDSVLAKLLEVLLIEAFRTNMDTPNIPGLLGGLADERLAIAIRKIHNDLHQTWTIDQLAKEAALSRTAFYKRFKYAVGCSPLEYVITWKMAIAKNSLRSKPTAIADIAEKIGYKSASAFSSAFSKHTGQSPSMFARTVLRNRSTG